MKQIRVHGPNDWRLDEIPSPTPGARDALVRIAACGICGSAVSYIHLGGLTKEPMALGHEMAGIVEWIGREVRNVAVGDRVIACPSDVGERSIGNGSKSRGLTPVRLVRKITETEMYPHLSETAIAELVEAAGHDVALERTEAALDRGEPLIAIQLGEGIHTVAPNDSRVNELMVRAHQSLLDSGGSENFWENGWASSANRGVAAKSERSKRTRLRLVPTLRSMTVSNSRPYGGKRGALCR